MVSTRLVRPLDDVRRTLWRWSARTSLGRACLHDRSLRLAVLAIGHIVTALTLTVLAPLWLMLLGPIVLGVPHVASDVRYLVARPIFPMPRWGLVAVLAPLCAMTVLRVMPLFGGPHIANHAAIEVALGMTAILFAVSLARTSLTLRGTFVVVALGLGALGVVAGHTAALVVAHGHNLVAFGFWLVIYRSEASWPRVLAVAAAYLGVFAAILLGAFDVVLIGTMDGEAGGLDYGYMVRSIAPGMDPTLTLRLVATYAFAQAMHYVIWIRLVPQRMDPRPAPPTFARTFTRLREDFGRVGLTLIALATVGFPLATLVFDALDVRLVYLLFIVAHGWLELAVFAALGVEAVRPASRAAT